MSALEDTLFYQLKISSLPLPDCEVRLIPGRRFRCDFVWKAHKLVVEVEGGSWIGGAHVRPVHFASDIEKYNELALMGYRILRFTGDAIKSGDALNMIERALEGTQ